MDQLFHHSSHHHSHQPMLLPRFEDATAAAHAHLPPTEFYCLYKTNKCRNLRGVKRDGTLHRLCNEHREKANESQRKSETKKRIFKRSQLDQLEGTHEHFPDMDRLKVWSPQVSHSQQTLRTPLVAASAPSSSLEWLGRQSSPFTSEHEDEANSTKSSPMTVPSRRMTLEFILVDDDGDDDDIPSGDEDDDSHENDSD
ncbi:hypothetical protein LEN26_015586 [Aphanomyces euteiches]|nr:hypothetical protein LEN26_015586 [Aphanomyces euteiches]KAH9108666.1 hypothetical protein AeMF1_016159 [Aphanomyces euteiches]